MANLQSNEYYFDLRSHYSYYESALKDYAFVNAVSDAIGLNASKIRDKVVLEIGSGTGVFAMVIARTGARHVYAWEPSALSETSAEVVKRNNLESRITVLNQPLSNIHLPEKVDVLFTAAFGVSFYLDSLLPEFLFARDNLLREGGVVMPRSVEFSLAAAVQSRYGRPDEFWNDVYGFDFTPIGENSFGEPYLLLASPQMIKSEPSDFLQIDFETIDSVNLDVNQPFTIRCNADHEVSSFLFWFKVGFQRDMVFDTAPYKDQTHFCQLVFDIKDPFLVKDGDVISGTFSIKIRDKKTRPIFYKISYAVNNSEEIQQIFVLQ